MVSSSSVVLLLLLQSSDEINAYNQWQPRKVKQIYWAEAKTTEVIVNLLPEGPKGDKPPVRLIFQVYIPGREAKGTPARLFVRALLLPLTITPFLRGDTKGGRVLFRPSLSLIIDGKADDLGPEGAQRLLYVNCNLGDPCPPDGVEVDLKPEVVRALVWGGSVEGTALGFPIRLSKADQAALFEFADRFGLISPIGRGE